MREVLKPLVLVISAITIGGCGLSFLLTYISLDMTAKGFTARETGLVHSIQHTAILLLGGMMPKAIAKFKHPKSYLIATLVALIGVAIQANAIAIWQMMPARFLIGAAYAVFFIIAESWINSLAPNHLRGRITSVYCGVLVGGFAVGSWLVAEFSVLKSQPYIFASVILIVACSLIWLARNSKPEISSEEHGNLRAAFKVAPGIILIAMIFGFTEIGLMSMLPVYGLQKELGEEISAKMLTYFMFGGTITLVLAGFLSDRFSRKTLLIACSLISAAIAPIVSYSLVSELEMGVILFIWGGAVLFIYPLMMATMGSMFTGKMLASATTAMMLAYGIGSLIGPSLLGVAMDSFGADGMMYTLCAAFLLAAVFPFIQNSSYENQKKGN